MQAKNVISAILVPSDAVPHLKKMDEAAYRAWLLDCEARCLEADVILANIKNGTKTEQANVHKNVDVVFQRELYKCRTTTDILLNSFTTKQINLVSSVFPCNAHEMWRVITTAYSMINTTDNILSLLDQLHTIR